MDANQPWHPSVSSNAPSTRKAGLMGLGCTLQTIIPTKFSPRLGSSIAYVCAPPIPANRADLQPGPPEEWLALIQVDNCIEGTHTLAKNSVTLGMKEAENSKEYS